MTEKRILVTGIGGMGGANFVRSLRLAEAQGNERFFIVGTDFNPYHIEFSDVDVRTRTPRHTDPKFLSTLLGLIRKYRLAFVHSQPSVEAKLIAESRKMFSSKVKTFLPRPKDIMPDKLYIHKRLSSNSVPVAKSIHVKSERDIDRAFKEMGHSLWIRAVSGAGGRLGLKVNSAEEAKLWIKLNVMQGRAKEGDFLVHEYLPGRDLAFDSLWFRGRLVTSYCRERLEYPFRHISLSGITGTPSVARTLHDKKVSDLGVRAILALDKEPHGFFSVDIKEDARGNPRVTEVDGKWHTTAPLWGYAFAKAYNKPEFNLAYRYVRMALDDKIYGASKSDLFPADHYLIRQMDCGVILKNNNKGKIWKIV